MATSVSIIRLNASAANPISSPRFTDVRTEISSGDAAGCRDQRQNAPAVARRLPDDPGTNHEQAHKERELHRAQPRELPLGVLLVEPDGGIELVDEPLERGIEGRTHAAGFVDRWARHQQAQPRLDLVLPEFSPGEDAVADLGISGSAYAQRGIPPEELGEALVDQRHRPLKLCQACGPSLCRLIWQGMGQIEQLETPHAAGTRVIGRGCIAPQARQAVEIPHQEQRRRDQDHEHGPAELRHHALGPPGFFEQVRSRRRRHVMHGSDRRGGRLLALHALVQVLLAYRGSVST
jgi:hypothetical protein